MSLLKKPKAPPPMPKSQKLLRMRKLPGKRKRKEQKSPAQMIMLRFSQTKQKFAEKRKNVEQEKMAKKATKLAFETLSSWMQRLRRKPQKGKRKKRGRRRLLR